MNATIMPLSVDNVIALCALLTSIVSILFTAKALRMQQEHNYLSVKPIGEIDLGDYETDIYVRIINNGNGPLLIKKMHVEHPDLNGKSIIDLLPDGVKLNMVWTTFDKHIENRSLQVNRELWVIRKTFPGAKAITQEEDKLRHELRLALSPLKITLVYTDIYEKKLYSIERELRWFKRRTEPSAPLSSKVE